MAKLTLIFRGDTDITLAKCKSYLGIPLTYTNDDLFIQMCLDSAIIEYENLKHIAIGANKYSYYFTGKEYFDYATNTLPIRNAIIPLVLNSSNPDSIATIKFMPPVGFHIYDALYTDNYTILFDAGSENIDAYDTMQILDIMASNYNKKGSTSTITDINTAIPITFLIKIKNTFINADGISAIEYTDYHSQTGSLKVKSSINYYGATNENPTISTHKFSTSNNEKLLDVLTTPDNYIFVDEIKNINYKVVSGVEWGGSLNFNLELLGNADNLANR